jgi:hypothetical protein
MVWYPNSANPKAMAFPIPFDAPVIIAVLFFIDCVIPIVLYFESRFNLQQEP